MPRPAPGRRSAHSAGWMTCSHASASAACCRPGLIPGHALGLADCRRHPSLGHAESCGTPLPPHPPPWRVRADHQALPEARPLTPVIGLGPRDHRSQGHGPSLTREPAVPSHATNQRGQWACKQSPLLAAGRPFRAVEEKLVPGAIPCKAS